MVPKGTDNTDINKTARSNHVEVARTLTPTPTPTPTLTLT